MKPFENVWKELQASFSLDQDVSAISVSVHLVVAAVLAMYIRMLYRKFGVSPSNTDSISRVFPLLALVTTAVIAVVKSSLALSLGLVGALSIVRFRAAIKDPEELVYLFLCIAIGLALGAEQLLLATLLVVVSTCVILGVYFTDRKDREQRLLLTIVGDAELYFRDRTAGAMKALDTVGGRYMLQRFDVENGIGQVRVVLGETNPQRTAEMIFKLRQQLPDCELSYVNLNSTI